MWNLFKIVNFFWLLSSTYMWPTAALSLGPILVVVNVLMIVCLSFLPIKIKLDVKTGLVVAAIILLALWYIWIDGAVMGVVITLQYLPALYLIQLPCKYIKDLLIFSTKWLAILLIPALLIYWVLLVVDLPSFGKYYHPNYEPYLNYIFYIKTTFDYGIFQRFNAFFLEPGHLALLCTFMMMANQYRFKKCKWLIVFALSVLFSFSLAGYLLAAISYILFKINSLAKGMLSVLILIVVVVGVQFIGEGDNPFNELIIERLEYDEGKGIKGNNRVDNKTDYIFSKTVDRGDLMVGVKNRVNMDLVFGAGFKVYIINYGLIGVLLSLMLYLTLIPSSPDYRYTYMFLFVLCLCFVQRAYPEWYSWLFPYISGIYIAKSEKDARRDGLVES